MLLFNEALSLPLDFKLLERGLFLLNLPISPVLSLVPTIWQTSHSLNIERKQRQMVQPIPMFIPMYNLIDFSKTYIN